MTKQAKGCLRPGCLVVAIIFFMLILFGGYLSSKEEATSPEIRTPQEAQQASEGPTSEESSQGLPDTSSQQDQPSNSTQKSSQETTQHSPQQSSANKLDKIAVHFIDVGQADSIFIDAGDYDILIDAGNNDDGDLVVNYLRNLNTDDIEIMVATHPHEDHIGGLDTVLAAYDVETIIDSGRVHTTKTYKDYIYFAETEGAKFLGDDDMTFTIAPGAVFKIIETGDNYEDMNDVSVVSMLDFGDVEFLFTGDMETEAELRALNKFSDIDILKVGHHGSHSSSSPAFLDKVKPEVAVISCGKDNKYGHPHEETLKALSDRGVKIYRTDIAGHIVITTDGKTYEVNKKPYTYTPTVVAPIAPKTKPATTKFVGSIESDKYHYPDCRWAKKIKPENLIEFSSVQEAQAMDYKPCGTCKPPTN